MQGGSTLSDPPNQTLEETHLNHQNHSKITVREAITEQDTTLFLQQLHAYFKRDICPDPKDEDLAYFLGDEYRTTLRSLHERKEDRLYYLFFTQNGQDIGFAMPVIYESEDGKCFILEFCLYPRFRRNADASVTRKSAFRRGELTAQNKKGTVWQSQTVPFLFLYSVKILSSALLV